MSVQMGSTFTSLQKIMTSKARKFTIVFLLSLNLGQPLSDAFWRMFLTVLYMLGLEFGFGLERLSQSRRGEMSARVKDYRLLQCS
jgi:hypothetical protein